MYPETLSYALQFDSLSVWAIRWDAEKKRPEGSEVLLACGETKPVLLPSDGIIG